MFRCFLLVVTTLPSLTATTQPSTLPSASDAAVWQTFLHLASVSWQPLLSALGPTGLIAWGLSVRKEKRQKEGLLRGMRLQLVAELKHCLRLIDEAAKIISERKGYGGRLITCGLDDSGRANWAQYDPTPEFLDALPVVHRDITITNKNLDALEQQAKIAQQSQRSEDFVNYQKFCCPTVLESLRVTKETVTNLKNYLDATLAEKKNMGS